MNTVANVSFRCTKDEKDKIQTNAEKEGLSVTQYLLNCTTNKEAIIYEPDVFKMTEITCNLMTELSFLKMKHPNINISNAERMCHILCQIL
ncbi:plasmid mobilization protein [Anaerocolumna xylanovorans]|uniref:Mobilization protein n=1 Tax=Anaerocolumna xylanovorans DSM 12503 TaxID=1121345 RepID=A0A1M7Y8F7_9FIRM|nr:hypothetical protein [Anaerocolumna xylanovorans]SHO48924.1 hypothetical protein SAMN02745217_02099 [Anaerocolumna xylanovorans DSM 12503]